uniref:glycosyltransferase family 32 protein n=1 Tax=Agathobacter sp. TaxID=2021311 RepID=UPI004055DD26
MLKIYNYDNFIDRVKDSSGIILLGAGKRLRDFEQLFIDTRVSDKVVQICDNAIEKQGTVVTIWDYGYVIKDVKQLPKQYLQDKIVVITVDDYGPLADDLMLYEKFHEVELVCLKHITALQIDEKSRNKHMPNTIRLSEKPLIPKKIHYCWFGGNPIPDKYKAWMESWWCYCSDYEIIEWNETNYDVSKNQYMYEAYKAKKWGFVPDYARLDIIYNHGGIYLDTDVELIRNIDDLLYQKGFAGFQDNELVAMGLGFGAVKQLPIVGEMLCYYNNLDFSNKDGTLNMTASPIYNTLKLQEYGLVCNGEYQILEEMTIYPSTVLAPKNMYTMRTVIESSTYSIHHYDGSWADEKSRYMNERLEKDMKAYKYNVY